MKSIYRLAILMAATAMLAATAMAAPAGAQLTAMQYGFPSIYQNAISTVFSKDILSATNFEDVNINFGAAGFGFPSISQVSQQTYYAEHTDYSHTEETAAFNYPYASVGGLGGLPYGLC